jgi:hypothetical protein
MGARTDMWARYRSVFEALPHAHELDVDALIDAWSQLWFLPDEVASWLARGILCPAQASKLRIEELREEAQQACKPPPQDEEAI